MLECLREEAARRGFIRQNDNLSPEIVFSLVRDTPYQRASSREPIAIIREWEGTCSGKHYLLNTLFLEMGYQTEIVMCLHNFARENTGHFSAALRRMVACQPVPDVHTFLRIQTDGKWTDVDATWPSYTESLGFPVNSNFRCGEDMTIACDPIEFFPVPAGLDPQDYEEQLIVTLCKKQSEKREQFI